MKISEYTDRLKTYLKSKDMVLKDEKTISYGIQLSFAYRGSDFRLRVYENSKGRITLDTSPIKDADLKALVLSFSAEPEENSYILPPPLIGTDETGKGDFFGSLCVGGVFADEKAYNQLVSAGVKDSKKLTDSRMKELKDEIRKICPHSLVVSLNAYELNREYKKHGNINIILARLHAQAAAHLIRSTGCRRVLTDKFTSKQRVQQYLEGLSAEFHEEPHAEKNMCVAAASILARCAFLDSIDEISAQFSTVIPLGAGSAADEAAGRISAEFGADALAGSVKTFFKNMHKITQRSTEENS